MTKKEVLKEEMMGGEEKELEVNYAVMNVQEELGANNTQRKIISWELSI